VDAHCGISVTRYFKSKNLFYCNYRYEISYMQLVVIKLPTHTCALLIITRLTKRRLMFFFFNPYLEIRLGKELGTIYSMFGIYSFVQSAIKKSP